MKPDCITCNAPLQLSSEGLEQYEWRCSQACGSCLKVGVPASIDITAFQRYALRDGRLDFSYVAKPLAGAYVPGARVFMAQILYHFIECTWGGCYNTIYVNCLVPHLDSPEVVDYVLRSPVIQSTDDVLVGAAGAKIYPDLLFRLRRVSSARVQDYLKRTFVQGRLEGGKMV